MIIACFPVQVDADDFKRELEALIDRGHIVAEAGQLRLRNRFVQRAIYGIMLQSQRKVGSQLRRRTACCGAFATLLRLEGFPQH
jgi:hypothetical protein